MAVGKRIAIAVGCWIVPAELLERCAFRKHLYFISNSVAFQNPKSKIQHPIAQRSPSGTTLKQYQTTLKQL